MKAFMDKDFLLATPTARALYHDYAEQMPVMDYHCHINPKEIWEDRQFDNITQVWLGGDHYKWRLMRAAGVEEKYITGDASDREKFQKWAETLATAVGNPLYHWSHLELKRFFGYEGILNGETGKEVGIVPRHFLEPRHGVHRSGAVGVADMQVIAGIIDGRGDVERFLLAVLAHVAILLNSMKKSRPRKGAGLYPRCHPYL